MALPEYVIYDTSFAATAYAGIVNLSVNPESATIPIVVGKNDYAATVSAGIGYLSVDPASATIPVFVGKNDYSSTSNLGVVGLAIAATSASNPIAVGANQKIVTSAPLTGGSDLSSAAITISMPEATASVDGYMSSAYADKLDNLYLQPPPTITGESTGFAYPESVIVTYDNSTRKITLTGDPTAYFQGEVVAALISGWESDAHTDTSGHMYYLYYDGSTFAWSTDVYPTFNNLLMATVSYRDVNKFGWRECHGLVMPWPDHELAHRTTGTTRISGGDLSSYVLASTTVADRRPDISDCVILDEDLKTINAALTSKLYSQRYLVGTNVITYTLDAADIIPLSANNPYYNSFSTPNWGQTLMPANSVATVWLFEVPATADTDSQKIRHKFIQPQWITQSTGAGAPQLAVAQSEELKRSVSELNLGDSNLVSSEYICIARITVQYTAGNWTIVAVNNLTGSQLLQIAAPAGSFLSSIAVSAPITGSGAVADPLAIAMATDAVDGYMSAAAHATLTSAYAHSITTTGTPHGTAYAIPNASTTGSAGSLKSPATTGLMTATGMGTGTTRAKTVRDADDTILELGGSYTPSGTWVWTTASVTWPTFNQSTTGTAAKATILETARAINGVDFDGSAAITITATPTAHQLDGALHTVSGLTQTHVMQALSATTFGFATTYGVMTINQRTTDPGIIVGVDQQRVVYVKTLNEGTERVYGLKRVIPFPT